MMTVHEVSRITGVSIRALHHYDSIGLLPPTETTGSGYRLYDDRALERLQSILLFRELEFPLDEIKRILDSPNFDREKAISQQIRLLELRKEHLDGLIRLAREIRDKGDDRMDFRAFDTSKIDEYARKAKETWGDTDAYREFEKKSAGRTEEEQNVLSTELMDIFREFGKIRDTDPAGPKAAALAAKLQDHITKNYYDCTDEILVSLGQMYAAGGEFTENIDAAGGAGTAEFAKGAIDALVGTRKKQ